MARLGKGRGGLRHTYWADTVRRFVRNPIAMLGMAFVLIVVLAALVGPFVVSHDPLGVSVRTRFTPPSTTHLFGTDELGRDVLARVVYGAQVSLIVSFAAVTFSLFAGTALGLLAGYFGRAADEIIMRLMDILFAFPAVLLAISILAILGPGMPNTIIAIGVVYTPIFARIARGSVLSVRGLDYVLAARAVGSRESRIMVRHILPNCMAPIVVETTLSLGFAILSEAALSFLGLGTQPPRPSLGRMLSEGRMFIVDAPWIGLFPGLAIMLAVLGFNLAGDGLRDAMDPKLRRAR